MTKHLIQYVIIFTPGNRNMCHCSHRCRISVSFVYINIDIIYFIARSPCSIRGMWSGEMMQVSNAVCNVYTW